jgi:Domain of unknown function (DU1801)
MQSPAKTVPAYLKELPEDRRPAISAIRDVIRKNLNPGFEEGMLYGMIGYYVPHSLYPAGYHCDPKQPLSFACLASQKNYMSLYMLSCDGSGDEGSWLREQFAKAGKKLDMGKSCIRFKKLEDLPLEVVAEAVRRTTVPQHISQYESALQQNAKTRAARGAQSPEKKKAIAKATKKIPAKKPSR